MQDHQLLRVSDVCQRLAIGRSKLYELIREGRLPVIHIGRSIRIPSAAIESFVDALVAEATSEDLGQSH